MSNLWASNHPRNFWQCCPDLSDDVWQDAIIKSIPLLRLEDEECDIDSALALTLGEERFGPDHWELGFLKRVYYLFKPIIPRSVARQLRRLYNLGAKTQGVWPIEYRYANFLWEVFRQVLVLSSNKESLIKSFWPNHNQFAFVLTHDIETSAGQEYIEAVADFEESMGFRSLFNFVPERYKLNYRLMDDLRRRGFEIGVHGLKHNGRLFDSKPTFMKNAERINKYLHEWDATGFRAELTYRQPEWMQALEIEYDLSFFDTDPFEPIPGGTMSIWPFFIGHFVELPYTLMQDYSLVAILGEKTPRLWIEKVDFIQRYYGMVLVNTHPDYLIEQVNWKIYSDFLQSIKYRGDYWHALPKYIAKWWRARSIGINDLFPATEYMSRVELTPDNITLT